VKSSVRCLALGLGCLLWLSLGDRVRADDAEAQAGEAEGEQAGSEGAAEAGGSEAPAGSGVQIADVEDAQ
jgi:hypothetical protein